MENASKALLMAGGVLIGILVLSLAIVLYTSFRESSTVTEKRIEADRLAQFNSQFSVFYGREDLTIYDVIKIASIANENNEKYHFTGKQNANENNFYIQVYVKFSDGSSISNLEYELENRNTWLEKYGSKQYTFKCSDIKSNISGRINYIKFEANT